MNEYLLSICIPTYNRAGILRDTLQSYINDEDFSNSIEIVISDNCSTDDTATILLEYTTNYTNIRFQTLSENIGADGNIIQSLLMGKGKYLKLMNDSVTFKPGALNRLVKRLEDSDNAAEPIYFYQNIDFLHSNEVVRITNIDQLVSEVSFWITWIANFGVWKSQFDLLEDKDRHAQLRFTQTDWTMRLVDNNPTAIIVFGDFYETADLKVKGGYNLFETFGINYFLLFKEYLQNGKLSYKTERREKYRLFRYFMMLWYRIMFIDRDERYTFEKSKANSILFKIYWAKPYFYLGMTWLLFRGFYKRILKRA